jgi:hypothetical protein
VAVFMILFYKVFLVLLVIFLFKEKFKKLKFPVQMVNTLRLPNTNSPVFDIKEQFTPFIANESYLKIISTRNIYNYIAEVFLFGMLAFNIYNSVFDTDYSNPVFYDILFYCSSVVVLGFLTFITIEGINFERILNNTRISKKQTYEIVDHLTNSIGFAKFLDIYLLSKGSKKPNTPIIVNNISILDYYFIRRFFRNNSTLFNCVDEKNIDKFFLYIKKNNYEWIYHKTGISKNYPFEKDLFLKLSRYEFTNIVNILYLTIIKEDEHNDD